MVEAPESIGFIGALNNFLENPKSFWSAASLYVTTAPMVKSYFKKRNKRKDSLFEVYVSRQMSILKNKLYADAEGQIHEYHDNGSKTITASFEGGRQMPYSIHPYAVEVRSVYEGCIDDTIQPLLVQTLYDERRLYKKKYKQGKILDYCSELAVTVASHISEDIGKAKGRSDILVAMEESALSKEKLADLLKPIFERAITLTSIL